MSFVPPRDREGALPVFFRVDSILPASVFRMMNQEEVYHVHHAVIDRSYKSYTTANQITHREFIYSLSTCLNRGYECSIEFHGTKNTSLSKGAARHTPEGIQKPRVTHTQGSS